MKIFKNKAFYNNKAYYCKRCFFMRKYNRDVMSYWVRKLRGIKIEDVR